MIPSLPTNHSMNTGLSASPPITSLIRSAALRNATADPQDPVSRIVRRAAVDVALSPKEFALLHELMRRPGQVLTRTHLIDHVWDFAYDGGSNIVDVYVRYLRDKVDRPFGRNTIPTVRGVGYRLDPDG